MKKTALNQPSEPIEEPTDISLCIAGANAFNNDVLADFIETLTGFNCYCIQHSDLHRLWEKAHGTPDLLFLDCTAMGDPKACKRKKIDQHLLNDQFRVICNNAIVCPG